MATIEIRYSPNTFDKIATRVKASWLYSTDEKQILLKMLDQMKREQFLLYMVEVYNEQLFDFRIPDYQKYKEFLVSEVYEELTLQLLEKYQDYEEISYCDLRKWYYGMTICIDFLNQLDRRFNAQNTIIRY